MYDALATALHTAALRIWGEPCVYAGQNIRAEFREAHTAVMAEGDTFVQSTSPSIALRLADLSAAPARGDSVTVSRGRTWKVTEIMPDAGGMARVMLRLVS